MSVDLPWPWWVTTLVAVTVAVAGAVIFLRATSSALRAVGAVLAIEGVLLAAVAPAVMDEDNMPATVAGSPRLTGDEFARRADANCARLNEFAATLGDPKTLAATAAFFDKLLPAAWRAYTHQGMLIPPEKFEGTGMRWMNAMALNALELEAARDAAKRGDQAAVDQAYERTGPYVAEAVRLSGQMGMKVCFASDG